jgi:hypothetical protein
MLCGLSAHAGAGKQLLLSTIGSIHVGFQHAISYERFTEQTLAQKIKLFQYKSCKHPRIDQTYTLWQHAVKRQSGVHMRKKSVLLGFAASGAIILGASTVAVPANAASLQSPSSKASTSSVSAGKVSPASVGSILCGGDLCIQRITSIVNGKATVKAWADTRTFTGTFYLSGGPAGYFGQSSTKQWVAGGAGWPFTGVPQGGTYTATAWNTAGSEIGLVTFGV